VTVMKVLLVVLFLLAIVLGAGPGIHLVNPDPTDPGASFTTFGLPTIYVWGLLWYVVQFGVIITAYFRFWTSPEPDADHQLGD
jgi:hypothetical protein